MTLLSKNKKIALNYEILDRYTAGIALVGHEVKALKTHHASLEGSYVVIREQAGRYAVLLRELYIPPYQTANQGASDPRRDRALLLTTKEIKKIEQALNTKGVTLVPTALKLERGMVKVEIALARGKKKYDKRQDIKQRDQERDAQREHKVRFK